MYLDKNFQFSKQQAITGTSDVASTNVWDVTTARKVFQGAGKAVKLGVQVTASGGTSPTFRARFVGADNAALTTNPVIIADTGVSAAIASTDIPVLYELNLNHQNVTKAFYGVMFTQGGTSPTATVNAHISADEQSNLLK